MSEPTQRRPAADGERVQDFRNQLQGSFGQPMVEAIDALIADLSRNFTHFSTHYTCLGDHERDLTVLKAKTAEQAETLSDLRDQVSNLADITAGLGRLVGEKDGVEVAVELATAPAPATAPPTSPPKPPTRPPASPPAPSGSVYWPSDHDDALRAEEEARAEVGTMSLETVVKVRQRWADHRDLIPDGDDGVFASDFLKQVRVRKLTWSPIGDGHLIRDFRVLGMLEPCSGHGSSSRCVICPAYRRQR